MRRSLIHIAITLLVLAGMLAYLWLGPVEPAASPDLTLVTVDGETLELQSLRGRPALVTFWASSCGSCIREMPHLVDLYNELSPQGLEIIAIAMYYDPPNRVLALRKAHAIPYTLALDIHSEAARAFGNVRMTPTSFLIAPDGRVVFRKTGVLNMERVRTEILEILESNSSVSRNPPPMSAGAQTSGFPLTDVVG